MGELEQLQQVARQTFRETFAEVNTPENMCKYLDERFSTAQLGAELQNPQSEFYVATMGERVIGYLKLNYGAAQTELQEEGALEIERIYVIGEFHGKQVGQLLYDRAIGIAREKGASYVWLGVWENNKRAIAFYRKNGFVAFDTHTFILGDERQTDLLMKI